MTWVIDHRPETVVELYGSGVMRAQRCPGWRALAGLLALVGCGGPATLGEDAAAWGGSLDPDLAAEEDTGSPGRMAEAVEGRTMADPPVADGTAEDETAEDETAEDGAAEDGAAEGSGDSAGPGVPYGFWGLDGYLSDRGLDEVQQRFGATVFQAFSTDPEWTVGTLLPMAEAAGMRVTLRMTGGPSNYTTEGSFDIVKWKAMLDRWEGSGVQEYIDDGTLVGHMILDDIDNFEVRDPTAAELDELARYSKERFPGLMTFVRKQATELPEPAGGRYRHLDAAVNQYRASEGDVSAYAAAERDAALALGLGVINGLNLADGGDGSSGQPGWSGDGSYAMSAAEIMTYGAVLVTVPECGMFLNWEYDGEEPWPDGTIGADYLGSGEVQAALRAIGREAVAHDEVDLLRP